MKYGIRSSSGGGRASARETIGRVAAGNYIFFAKSNMVIICTFRGNSREVAI